MDTIIYGGAGCGKTEALINAAVHTLDNTHLRNICMMTKTRNARSEFVARMKAATGVAKPNDFKWFGTLNSVAWRLSGHTKDNMVLKNVREAFREQSGRAKETVFLHRVIEIDELRRNCMLHLTKKGFRETMKIGGLDISLTDMAYKCNITKQWRQISMDDLMEYGSMWNEFMDKNDVHDYVGSVAYCLNSIKDGSCEVPFTKLFVDEFQDFSPLEHEVYIELRKHVDDTTVVGDDLQTIFKFTGASERFLLNGGFDNEVILPKTYRYGSAILENSMKYIKRIKQQKERTVQPAEREGIVKHLRGDGWIKHIGVNKGSTVFLAQTNALAAEIAQVLDKQCVIYGILGDDSSPTEKLINAYNTLFALGAGKTISPAEAKELVIALPASINVIRQQTLGEQAKTTKKRYLKQGVSQLVKAEGFIETQARTGYTIDAFGDDFMYGGALNASGALGHIKGMDEFMVEKKLNFTERIVGELNHYVGTIHKFKGNEADNVFLFTQMPYPVSEYILFRGEVRDAQRRLFYVGATRARYTLYEVSDYFKDKKRRWLRNVSDIL